MLMLILIVIFVSIIFFATNPRDSDKKAVQKFNVIFFCTTLIVTAVWYPLSQTAAEMNPFAIVGGFFMAGITFAGCLISGCIYKFIKYRNKF